MSNKVKKVIHICIIAIILVAIAFAGLMIMLDYNENGETNMPFEISKITIVSTVDAQDVEDAENRWNEKVFQNNDIYIDIKKNEEYSKTRIIKSIEISNLQVISNPPKGQMKFYKPSNNELKAFENTDEYLAQDIVYQGDKGTDIQNLKVANQGGRIAFRCANNDIGEYISNEEEELNYDTLLNKMGLEDEELSAKISFDINIMLTNNKSFKGSVELEIPAEEICEKGRTSKEIEKPEVVFKR